MAKFIKSIFQSPAPEMRASVRDGEIEGEADSPISDRRKLSMSRSGRLKHSYKKRHSLSMELYGNEDDMQPVEKPKSMEYHVHATVTTTPKPQVEKSCRISVESDSTDIARLKGSKSPEEEIDSAFEIIDKS